MAWKSSLLDSCTSSPILRNADDIEEVLIHARPAFSFWARDVPGLCYVHATHRYELGTLSDVAVSHVHCCCEVSINVGCDFFQLPHVEVVEVQ